MRPRGENVHYDDLLDRHEIVVAAKRKLDARVEQLEAALREIAGNGRVPSVVHKFGNAHYRAGFVGGFDYQSDIAKAALTQAETACEHGKKGFCQQCEVDKFSKSFETGGCHATKADPFAVPMVVLDCCHALDATTDTTQQEARIRELEAALTDMTADYHRWHDAYMTLKYPEGGHRTTAETKGEWHETFVDELDSAGKPPTNWKGEPTAKTKAEPAIGGNMISGGCYEPKTKGEQDGL